ncbi:double-strand break repair helicase AddA [Brevundimonas sp.]|uniref:double-strand break repair helicase AddA n=2 Tax=unclassified Brevundimonas TaxID=2622653 RepID=UPI00289E12B9|nr:double-strand break repair helicase AddA [Brevundimonas sp.]
MINVSDLTPVERAKYFQSVAAGPESSIFVTANAGSGKTTTLVNRVARLLLKRVQPAEILCVTYTKAAAAEMQARLFEKLGHWAVADDETLRGSLADLEGRSRDELGAQDLSNARRLFARALETPGGLKIQTIHAFCEKLLRRFPLEAGVTPGFKVLEDQAAVRLSRNARDDLARHALVADDAVSRAYEHFALTMDFGSFNDLLSLIEAKREALGDYLDAVAKGLAPSPREITGAGDQTAEEATDDFIRYISQEEWRDAAAAMEAGAKTDTAIGTAMRAALADWRFDALGPVFLTQSGSPRAKMCTKSIPPVTGDYLGALQDKFIATQKVVRKIRVAEETEHLLTLARLHRHFYDTRKQDEAALDFTDLVGRTAELLTKRSNAAWVLFKLDGGIEHILIDEAQDTAPEQWEIMRALTESFYAGDGAERERAIERTVFAVGDEKQSIYSFQGARPEQLLKESRRYQLMTQAVGAQFEQVRLETSFRSTPEVLGFVDAVFAHPDRARALNGTGDIEPHLPARAGQGGSVEMWPLFKEPERAEKQAWQAPVDQESEASARKQLARALAREIKQQVADGRGIWAFDPATKTSAHRPARYCDFLVLVRRRDATFEEIIRALKMEGVPVAGADRLKLNEHIVFDDLLSLARFALYPQDDLSLAEILRSPLCQVPDFGAPHDLYHLANVHERGRRSLWQTLQQRKGEQAEWGEAHDLLQSLIEAREADPFTFFGTALNHVFADGRSGRARILDRLGREAEEAIDETLSQVLAAEERGGRDLETCLYELEQSQVEVKREMEGARDEVRVMTVHGSKGLEAPVVILPDTTSKAKPQGPRLMPVPLGDAGEGWLMCPAGKDDCEASAEARALREQRTDEESLRLLYVALTRAKDRLIIMGREVGRNKLGYVEGSWWDILQQTFTSALETGSVKTGPDGRSRLGELPPCLPPERRVAAEAVQIPDWAITRPAADASARFAAPSQMEAERKTKRIPAPSPLATAPTGGAALGRFRRGDLIHRLLERLPDIAPDLRRTMAERLLSKETDLDDDQRAEMITAAFSVLDDARFAPVFGPGSRAEVALTGTAPELPAGVKINGQIDRLVITPERVLVVDYKTNRPAPDDLDNVDPAYLTQLAVYAAVLRQLYRDRTVEAALVWTDGPKLMPVPNDILMKVLT